MTSNDPSGVERGLLRSGIVLGLIAILVPLGLHLLFERQLRRLEALGDHGVPILATVISVGGPSVAYEHFVDGVRHEWSVAPEQAPTVVGATFAAHYLPEDPSFSRPGSDRGVATREAESHRSGIWKGLLGAFWFFVAFAVQSLSELRVLRRVGAAAYTSTEGRAAAVRRRLVWLGGGLLLPMVAAIGLWHAGDARAHDESVIPVVLGVVLSLGVLGGTVAYSLREGPDRAAERAGRVARWVVPLGLAVAMIRMLLLWLAPNG